MSDSNPYEELEYKIFHHSDPEERAKALEKFGMSDPEPPNLSNVIHQALDDPSEKVRITAVDLLDFAGNQQSILKLKRSLKKSWSPENLQKVYEVLDELIRDELQSLESELNRASKAEDVYALALSLQKFVYPRMKNPSKITHLLNQILKKSDAPNVKIIALQTWTELADPNSESTLLKILEDPVNSDETLKYVFQALGAVQSQKAVDNIIKFLKDRSHLNKHQTKSKKNNVVLAALHALGNIGSNKSLEFLLNYLKNKKIASVYREEMVSIVAQNNFPHHLKNERNKILQNLAINSDESTKIRMKVIESIPKLEDPSLSSVLKTIFHGKDAKEIQIATIQAMADLGDRSFLKSLIARLTDKDANIREALIQAIEILADPSDLELFEKKLAKNNFNKEIKKHLKRIVKKLTDLKLKKSSAKGTKDYKKLEPMGILNFLRAEKGNFDDDEHHHSLEKTPYVEKFSLNVEKNLKDQNNKILLDAEHSFNVKKDFQEVKHAPSKPEDEDIPMVFPDDALDPETVALQMRKEFLNFIYTVEKNTDHIEAQINLLKDLDDTQEAFVFLIQRANSQNQHSENHKAYASNESLVQKIAAFQKKIIKQLKNPNPEIKAAAALTLTTFDLQNRANQAMVKALTKCKDLKTKLIIAYALGKLLKVHVDIRIFQALKKWAKLQNVPTSIQVCMSIIWGVSGHHDALKVLTENYLNHPIEVMRSIAACNLVILAEPKAIESLKYALDRTQHPMVIRDLENAILQLKGERSIDVCFDPQPIEEIQEEAPVNTEVLEEVQEKIQIEATSVQKVQEDASVNTEVLEEVQEKIQIQEEMIEKVQEEVLEPVLKPVETQRPLMPKPLSTTEQSTPAETQDLHYEDLKVLLEQDLSELRMQGLKALIDDQYQKVMAHRDSKTLDLYQSALRDPSIEVRIQALKALHLFYDETLLKDLQACLDNPSESLRIQTVEALANINALQTKELLFKATQDPSKRVQLRAWLALKEEVELDVLYLMMEKIVFD